MSSEKQSTTSENKNISIGGNVVDSVVIAGDHNTVNKTVIQKFFNIFKGESESLAQRNRRILLGHVETAWIKGVLEQSLHGAALLELGFKEDPEAVKEYPWAIKRESTNETLPAGMSMLEIFNSIGMGRSLLILGAPGSGKTTMLLELTRQLIEHARQNESEPIPMVFNLASWTEKLTLANWLAQELNNLYSVPLKTAPDWVDGNKLLLLLDGLDEVRQESRSACVEAINVFRKEHGLTCLAVCSRSQDYVDLDTKLSFEGAIEVQSLTQEKIADFFERFGGAVAGIKQALEKDSALREMAETPLFLSIMLMAYRDKRGADILVSPDENIQRTHLFNTYIERMFEHPRARNTLFKKQDTTKWLSWLAQKMIQHNQVPYVLEDMQPKWLDKTNQALEYEHIPAVSSGLVGWSLMGLLPAWFLFVTPLVSFIRPINAMLYGLIFGIIHGIIYGFMDGLIHGLILHINARGLPDSSIYWWIAKIYNRSAGASVIIAIFSEIMVLTQGIIVGLLCELFLSLMIWPLFGLKILFFEKKTTDFREAAVNELAVSHNIKMIESLRWSWKQLEEPSPRFQIIHKLQNREYPVESTQEVPVKRNPAFEEFIETRLEPFFPALIIGLVTMLWGGLFTGLSFGLGLGLLAILSHIKYQPIDRLTRPGQKITASLQSLLFMFMVVELSISLIIGLIGVSKALEEPGRYFLIIIEFVLLVWLWFRFGVDDLLDHLKLRIVLSDQHLLPWKLILFLDHCRDLIFLRRVGGGYIFIHRLLMEHFAEIQVEVIKKKTSYLNRYVTWLDREIRKKVESNA